jgi:hypothetical protein
LILRLANVIGDIGRMSDCSYMCFKNEPSQICMR